MSQTLQFGYFNFQGRGQITRLLLAYTKTSYNQVGYSLSKIGEWMQKDKLTLGFDFPSLPYIIDGKIKITESRAIEKYILHRAKRADMLGMNSKEKAFIDNIDGVLRDIFAQLAALFFAPNFEECRKKTFGTISQKLSYINSFIGQKNHLLSRLTYVDFVLSVLFGYLKFYYPHEFTAWNNIIRVGNFVNNLPEIQAYYQKPESITAIVAPERATDPRFVDIKPINHQEKQQAALSIQIQKKDSQQVQVIKPKEKHSATENLKQTSVQQTKPEEIKSQNKQAPAAVKQVQTNVEQKAFNTRVEQYKRAVQAANLKGSSQVKTQLQKSTIVSPSKIGSSIKSKGSSDFSWKIQNQTKQNNQTQKESTLMCLGYWGIRGLGQVQRHLLTYCGQQFTEKIYSTREEWSNSDKINLNLPFPNLPYLIAGDLKLTESLAIDRYIIRTSGHSELLGKNLLDQTLIQNITKILSELFAQLRAYCFTEEDEKKKTELTNKLDTNFQRMGEFIKNRQYAFGYLTLTDFYLAQISYYIKKIFSELYSKHSFLKNIQQSIIKNSEIQKYYERNGSVKGPFMPPSAKISF